MQLKRLILFILAVGFGVSAICFRAQLGGLMVALTQIRSGKKTIADRIEQFGPVVRERLGSEFEKIGVVYPPTEMTLVGIKKDKRLEVWVSDPPKLLKSYPVLGASGHLGPKLKEGDRQVPEGIYRIESLNPNSRFHLALRVNYPNSFDIEKGQQDRRTNLGGDIMIHGKKCSIGCLAMGDEAAEDLFVLANDVGIENIVVILAPVDFRTEELSEKRIVVPDWTQELYEKIKKKMARLEPGACE